MTLLNKYGWCLNKVSILLTGHYFTSQLSAEVYKNSNSKPNNSAKKGSATAKSLQSCPTLCDPRDGSPPGSPVPGILQARTLEWVAISFSNA